MRFAFTLASGVRFSWRRDCETKTSSMSSHKARCFLRSICTATLRPCHQSGTEFRSWFHYPSCDGSATLRMPYPIVSVAIAPIWAVLANSAMPYSSRMRLDGSMARARQAGMAAAATGGEVPKAGSEPTQGSHARSPAFTSKKRAMMAAVCSQSRFSASSNLYPARVSR